MFLSAFGWSEPRRVSVMASDGFPSFEAVPQVLTYEYGFPIGIVIIMRFVPPFRSAIAPGVSEARRADAELL